MLTTSELTPSMICDRLDKLPVLAVNEIKTVVHTDIIRELSSMVRPLLALPIPSFLHNAF